MNSDSDSDSEDFARFLRSQDFAARPASFELRSPLASPADQRLFAQHFRALRAAPVASLAELSQQIERLLATHLVFNSAIKTATVHFRGLPLSEPAGPHNYNQVFVEVEPRLRSRETPFNLHLPREPYRLGSSAPLRPEVQAHPFSLGVERLAAGLKLGSAFSARYGAFLRADLRPFWSVEAPAGWRVLFPSVQLSETRKRYAGNWQVHCQKAKLRLESDIVPRPRLFLPLDVPTRACFFYELLSEKRRSEVRDPHAQLLARAGLPHRKTAFQLGALLSHCEPLRAVHFKGAVEFARLSRAEEAQDAHLLRLKSRLVLEQWLPALYLRGLVRFSSVRYHEATPAEAQLPLVDDSAHVCNFPGLARQLTADNLVSDGRGRSEPLGLTHLLWGSWRVFLTGTPQLPVRREGRNRRMEFVVRPFAHLNWAVDLTPREDPGARSMGWLERIRKTKRGRLSAGLGLSVQAAEFALNFTYTPFVVNPHCQAEGRQEVGLSLGLDF